MGEKPGFLGRGILWPMGLSAGRGIALSEGVDDIEQSIRLILATRLGERRMRPDFGCRIHEHVFAPNNSSTHGLIQQAVEDALVQWEHRIIDTEVSVIPDDEDLDRVNVQVNYKVRSVNSSFNLVYPFYLQGS